MKKPRVIDYILKPEDRKKLIAACVNEREKFVVKGLLYTGLRISEFIHLNRSWIEEASIKVPKKQKCACYECVSKRGGFWKVKTKRAERIIPILPEVEGMFNDYFGKHSAVMDTVPSRLKAWKIVCRVGKKAGLKVFPHAIRATLASSLAEKGVEDRVILEVMGWAKMETADIYIRVSGAKVDKEIRGKWGKGI